MSRAKTAKEVQTDVLALLKNSTFPSLISGGVYREGYRPRDSKLEDAIVIFTAGLADEFQSGIVTLNIYVPDIDPYSNGTLVENGARTAGLEAAIADWVESLPASSDYKFELNQTIHTAEAEEIHQHFVVVKLKYKLLTD